MGRNLPVGLGGTPPAIAWVAVFALADAPIVAFVAARRGWMPRRAVVGWIGFTAMGLSSLLIVFFLVSDVLRLPVSPLTVLGLAAVVTVAGVLQARQPRVVRVRVPITDLPRDLE